MERKNRHMEQNLILTEGEPFNKAGGREKQRGTSKKSDITGWGDIDEYT